MYKYIFELKDGSKREKLIEDHLMARWSDVNYALQSDMFMLVDDKSMINLRYVVQITIEEVVG